jgi:2-hydroxycyclohexanecarboxyl-CoA dehydrogenase
MASDRVAFITGAGRGIGRALAIGFANAGYRVVVGSTTMARNEVVAAEIKAQGGAAMGASMCWSITLR